MNQIQLSQIDLNLLVTFEALMDLGSVALAAERLGRTPSAVSHALARLREQLGDPLLVKVGGKMQPSPYALKLIEEIRPLLRGIERVITPPAEFDPQASERTFRVAIPAFPTLVAILTERVTAQAPKAELEWLPLRPQTAAGVQDESIDVACLAPGSAMPDGLECWRSAENHRLTFARPGHPAIADWGMDAWLAYPHVVVGIGGAARQTVQEAVERDGLQRRIGARVTEFAGLAPLIARTDNLGTFAPIGTAEDALAFDLAFLEPPIHLPPISFPIVWSTRLTADAANRWLRELVIASFEEATRRIDDIVASANIVRPKKQ